VQTLSKTVKTHSVVIENKLITLSTARGKREGQLPPTVQGLYFESYVGMCFHVLALTFFLCQSDSNLRDRRASDAPVKSMSVVEY